MALLQALVPNGHQHDEDIGTVSAVVSRDVIQRPSRDEDEALRHPLGVKPSGNALTSIENLQGSMGLFAHLPDALVLTLLEYLDDYGLVHLGQTCRAFFAYSTFDQMWRDITVNDPRPGFQWYGSWRASRRRLKSARLPPIDCGALFSDSLHRPFLCSQIPLEPYASNIPSTNQLPRLSHLSTTEFSEAWTGRPFILTDPVKGWDLYRKWDQASLLNKYGSTVFRAEAVDWPLDTYVEYMNSTKDESPLYLFDRGFVEKMNLAVGEGGSYQPPECFGEDLFTLLGEQRPDYRWLIVGPERSGSTFHKDPNATSAWNAVVRGSKYWIMFPNSIIPPGVYMSEDQSEVTSPLSIAEWLLTFHEEARNTPGCLEGVCGEGEVLHVPSGWWHLVVNLEPAIAITQNFVPESHVRPAINFLKNKSSQVSGFKDNVKDPYALFMERLREAHPELAASVENTSDKKRKWEDVVAPEDEGGSGVARSFGFGFADDDIEEE